MKPVVVKILIGIAGFAGGFAAGFLVHKKMNNIQFEEISEAEMAEIENKVKKDIPEKAAEKSTESHTSEQLGAAQELPETPDELRNHLQGKKPYIQVDAEQKTAYEKLWKATKEYSNSENANALPVTPVDIVDVKDDEKAESESPEEENFDENFLEQIEQEAVEAGNNFAHPPYQVDLAGFWNDHPEFDHVTIKYYEPDNVWLDENDEIIADISSYIGTNKDLFKTPGMDDDEDVRFICNERYGTNYEIIRHHRSYRETVGE